MPTPQPTWHVAITQGLSPGVQLRAALLLLQMRQKRAAFCQRVSLGGPWCRLMSLDEQAALYRLYSQEAPGQSGGAVILDSFDKPRHLLLTDAHHVHAGLHDQAWLGLLDGDPSALQHQPGQRVWQLGTGDLETLQRGPDGAGPWRLPWPVHDVFTTAPSEPLGAELLLIAGPHPPEQAIVRLQKLHANFGRGVRVFDPYDMLNRPQYRQALPAGAQVLGLACAQERRQFFAACTAFVVDAPDSTAVLEQPIDDAFALEALAMGLVPWTESTPDHDSIVTPKPVGVSVLVDALLDGMEGRGPDQAAVRATAHDASIVLVTRLADAAVASPGSQGPRGLMLVGSLPEGPARADLARNIGAGAYTMLATHIGPHTTFLPQLMMAHLSRPIEYLHDESPQLLWRHALNWLEAAGPRSVLHVLVPSADSAKFEEAKRWQAQWAQNNKRGSQPLPILAISSGSDVRVAGASPTHVGSAVASHDIAWGLARGLQGACTAKWLRLAGADYDSHSTFMHALTRQQDATGQAAAAAQWSAATLRLALMHNQVDGIFMAGGPLGAATQAMRCAYARRPVPILSVLHGMLSPGFQLDIAAFLLNGPVYPFDGFISPSQCGREVFERLWESLRQWLLRQGHKQVPGPIAVEVIPYGVDTAFYAPRSRLSCRQNLALPPHDVTILSLGRISRRFKTCLMPLLLAMQQLQRQGVRPKLVIAGALMAKQELVRLKDAVAALHLQDQVHFRTSVSLDDKAQLLSAADVFVALSDSCQETHGLAPIEAMAAGLPVVAAAWNGYRELVVHGETGFLIPTAWSDVPEALFVDNALDKQARDLGYDDLHETVATDVAALAQALATLCDNSALRASMGARGRARAAACYDAKAQGLKLAEHTLEKMRQAASFAPSFCGPERYLLVDRVDQRFKHYATDWLGGDEVVRLGPLAQDADHRRAIVAYIGPRDDAESEMIDEIVEQVAAGPVKLSALLSPRVDMLRLMRCLKYNILQRAQGPQ